LLPVTIDSLLSTEANDSTTDESDAQAGESSGIQKINFQPSVSRRNANRYALSFHRETVKEMKAQKDAARKPIQFILRSDLETGDEYFQGYDFPIRPKWSYDMSKEAVDRNENRYFTEYVMKLEKSHAEKGKTLSYCELNLETWRQLWRVLEISDIILVIVDARYPSLQFPPSLFEYVTQTLKKHMILVLNKIDLVPSHIVLAWKHYFEETYKDIRVILFTSYPSYNLRSVPERDGAAGGLKILRRRGKMRMAKEGAYQIQQACKAIVKAELDISSWENKIIDEIKGMQVDDTLPSTSFEQQHPQQEQQQQTIHADDTDFDMKERVRFQNDILTVGCVGFPNVGKSSLMNALMGKKVVSVSKTPGHTKHFQTIFLTNNVRLCDCPGLVFPSSVPRKLQVLIGSYPIAQLREPYASVQYLAERIDLVKTLNVKVDGLWSAMEICDAWALARGFITAKAARPDTNRAANHILRMTLNGQIVLSLLPPDFVAKEDTWQTHEGISDVEAIKALGISEDLVEVDENFESDSENDDDTKDEESDNEDNSQDDDDTIIKPKRNAFELLDDDDED
ncbi:guanine nucleotide-binding protein-like 1, partial [Contarinia nasturtii]|uniref:guanine nucleotide-binding protein-like 1 n=1 Tax=Contarinia nasturtii TaxID=265458 RepID=UPI0012D3BA4D